MLDHFNHRYQVVYSQVSTELFEARSNARPEFALRFGSGLGIGFDRVDAIRSILEHEPSQRADAASVLKHPSSPDAPDLPLKLGYDLPKIGFGGGFVHDLSGAVVALAVIAR